MNFIPFIPPGARKPLTKSALIVLVVSIVVALLVWLLRSSGPDTQEGSNMAPPPDLPGHGSPLESIANESTDRKAIEHIIQTELPESVDHCKYDGKGFMGSGVARVYFEIPKTDLTLLLNKCDVLPDTSELGQHAGSKWNIEHPGKELGWWKPSELKNRQYAGKEEGTQPIVGRRIDICVGNIDEGLMGVYLVYHVD